MPRLASWLILLGLSMLLAVAGGPPPSRLAAAPVPPASPPGARPSLAAPTDCALTWRLVASPSIAQCGSSVLNAVSARAADDIWAVGKSDINVGWLPTPQVLIEHWDGQTWEIVPVPEIGP